MIIVSVIGTMAAIAIPNFRAARERANSRACYANQKTISGAVEMYNLDKNTKRTDFSVTLNDLKAWIPAFHGRSRPGRRAKQLSVHAEWNGIACRVHGPIQE
jgi:type II secretory pathway pseudopilin PulG